MMDYKQMAEIVTKEVDAILERKKRRAIIVKRVSLTVSGFCAAGIVGVGIWHNDKIKNAIHHDNDPSVITEISETTSENAVSTVVTTKETTDTKSAVNSTTTAKNQATVTSDNSTTALKTTKTETTYSSKEATTVVSSSVSPSTTAITANAENTSISSAMTSTVNADTTALPTKVTNATTKTMNTTGTSTDTVSTAFRDIFRASTVTFVDSSITYEKENIPVSFNKIGDQISNVNVQIVTPEAEPVFYEMEIYEITDKQREQAVALYLSDTDEYYLCTAQNTINEPVENQVPKYVIRYKDIDKNEIDRIASEKSNEYEESLYETMTDYREIENLSTTYYQKLRSDMRKEAYMAKAAEILECLGVDPSSADCRIINPIIVCNLTDEQYEKALQLEEIIAISISTAD